MPRRSWRARGFAGPGWHSFSIPTVALRYFNVYGPGQDPKSEYAAVIPRFTVACLTGGTPVVYGDGEQARDFTYIDDVVTANLLAARAPEAARGRVLNIGGGGKPTSVNALLSMIAKYTETQPVPFHEPPRDGDIMLTEADVSLARSLIGYEPEIAIEEGVRRTVEWFQRIDG